MRAQVNGSPAGAPPRVEILSEREARQRELDQARQREQAIVLSARELEAERERLKTELMDSARTVQVTEAKLTSIESRLTELEIREKFFRDALAREHEQLAGLLAAMQRMGRNPPPIIATQRTDALAMVRSAMALAQAFPELKAAADKLKAQIDGLVRIKAEIETERDRLRGENIRLASAQTRLEDLMKARDRSLAERSQELAEIRAASERLGRNIRDLDSLLSSLDAVVRRNTELGAYDEALRRERQAEASRPRAADAQAPGPTQGSPPATAPDAPDTSRQVAVPGPDREPVMGQSGSQTSETPPRATGLRSDERDIALASPPRGGLVLRPTQDTGAVRTSRLVPSIPFDQAKGKLPLPVVGRRVRSFGERMDVGRGRSDGIVLETRPNARVTSPSDGWVVYAGEFGSFRHVLIINAGGGYHVMLAGLARIDAQIGDFVLASEPVGVMGATVGAEGAPLLFVQFRKGRQAIDPDPWWSKGQIVAQR